jgi:hypothetical protein
MLRTSLILTVALLCACYSVPNDLEHYSAPALTVHAHFADLPAGDTALAQLNIALVYLDHSSPEQQYGSDLVNAQMHGEPTAQGDVQFTLAAGGNMDRSANSASSHGPLRFFRLSATLDMSQPGAWVALGFDLVWAADAVTFYPFGPAYPSVSVPKGYSWLRRQCGPSPGQIQMDVRPIDETVVFRHVDSGHVVSDPFTRPLEPIERSFVESCGTVIPAQDLGTRVAFDRTSPQSYPHSTPLLWSADGTNLAYLSQADPKDPEQTVGLRQVRLPDEARSELATVPFGWNLQQDPAGQLYVATRAQLFRVYPTAIGPATLDALPIPSSAVLSPDGLWFAWYGLGGEWHLWSVATGAEVAAFDGNFVGWSPDSKAAYMSGTALSLVSPTNPTQPTVYETSNDAHMEVVAWSSQGPVLVRRPNDWLVGFVGYPPFVCMSCLGLSLQSTDDSTERQVLDASAGRIDFVSTPPVLDTLLAWAQNCLGLYDTVCTYSLIRIGLTDGTARTVATAADKYPVALSPDGQRVAIAAPSGIYVKNLSP